MAKRKKGLWNIVLVIIALVVLVPCGILLKDAIMGQNDAKVSFYYMMTNGEMKALPKDMPIEEEVTMTFSVLDELKHGIKSDGVQASVPENIMFQSVNIKEGIATIDVSAEYYLMSGTKEAICRSSLVWTLTSLDFIDAISITVEGNPLVSKTGESYGLLNRQNVLIDAEVSPTTTEYAILKLYFSNTDGTDLVVEDRVVEVNANQARERTILEQLIAGPKEKGNFATIPTDTKIRDITTTGDGICYVNLSQDFVSKHSGGTTGELLTIYSIVNSLCELETVDRVQFLIEGEKLDAFKGHVDFSTPFSATDTLKRFEKKG